MSKELQDALRKLRERDVDTFPATVKAVDKAKGTCTVNDGDLDFTGVRLSAVIDGSNKRFYVFPKVGSSVLVSPIKEDIRQLYIESYSEVESTDIIIDSVRMRIDKDGFLLKKENETLKKLIDDLLQAILNMRFTTNYGPTINLINAQEFTLIKNRFNQFLKDN